MMNGVDDVTACELVIIVVSMNATARHNKLISRCVRCINSPSAKIIINKFSSVTELETRRLLAYGAKTTTKFHIVNA